MRALFVRASLAFLVISSALIAPSLALSKEKAELGAPRFAVTLGSPTIGARDYATTSETATVSIGSVSQAEGDDGTTAFVFEVTLSEAIDKAASVGYMTMNGEATTENLDFVAASGTASFASMSTSTTITINVNGDTKFEEDETFTVELSSPMNATIGTGTGTGTIVNDDDEPTISIGSASQSEGNDGTTSFDFEVSLDNEPGVDVTFDYTTMNGSATTENLDYVAATGTATIGAKSISTMITIEVNGDTIFEDDETFTVELSNVCCATIGTGTGTGTIVNDDELPKISIGDASDDEGLSGTTTTFTFTLCLSDNEHEEMVTVDYETMNGSATTANGDYVAASGTLTFAPKELSCAVINVTVNGDATFEENETFTVVLSNPQNATIASSGTGTGTIVNDDFEPTISINNVSKSEGNVGTSEFDFEVSLSHAHYDQVTVHYATMDGGATTANNDYVAATGTATIAAKETSTTITITVNGDTKFEEDETFKVMLSNPENATIANGTGTGTIQNDDTIPEISINNVSEYEGNVWGTPFQFEVKLSNEHHEEVRVDYATKDGFAMTANGDYVSQSGTIVFPPKSNMTMLVVVQVNGDIFIEPDEDFYVELSNPMNATIADNRGRGLIFNDDGLTGVADPPVTEFALGSLAPNPFTDVTRIDYAVPREAEIKLSVYDIQGREVVVLASGIHRPGRHQATWKGQIEGRQAAAGVYFVRYRVPGKDFVRRLAITR